MTTENFDRWDNDGSKGPNNYDWAIAGIPFLSGVTTEYPYIRQSLDTDKQQINTSKEVGEQALGNWWYRSQNSFDLGTGIVYTDTSKDENISRRFFDSHGIDALDVLSQVKLQNKTTKEHTLTTGDIKLISYYANGKSGYIYSSNTSLYFKDSSGANGTVDYGAVDETILDLETDGNRYFVLTPTSVYYGNLADLGGYFTAKVSGTISAIQVVNNNVKFTATNTFKYGDVITISGSESNNDGTFDIARALIIDSTSTEFTIRNDYSSSQYNIINGPEGSGGIATSIQSGWKVVEIDKESEDDDLPADAGKIKFVKDRLIIAIRRGKDSYLLQSAVKRFSPDIALTPTLIQGVDEVITNGVVTAPKGIRLTFPKNVKWTTKKDILKVENSTIPQYNFDIKKDVAKVEGVSKNVARVAESILPAKIKSGGKMVYQIDKSETAKVYTKLANLAVEIYKSSTTNFNWTGIADGPTGIYFSGYAGEKSSVLFSTVYQENNSNIPELQAPYVVADLPSGEIIYSMVSYMSTLLILGTNKGVRVCIIDGRGSLIVGPLSVKSDNAVKALEVSGDFVYAGGGKSIDASGVAKVCIYKLDLTKPVEQNSLLYSYQKFLFNNDNTYADANEVTDIIKLNNTNKVMFAISGIGILKEHDSEKVQKGWIETGKIRLDTSEDKVFQYLRVTNSKDDGFISVYWRDEDGILSSEYINRWYSAPTVTSMLPTLTSTDGIKVLDMSGTSSTTGETTSHPYISYRFVLERGTTNTNTPLLFGYQLKANPANIKQTVIRLPLLALQKEKASSGLTITRPVYERIKALEDAEHNGKVILFQDFGTGEECPVIIDKLQFISNFIPESKTSSDRGGIILLTVRTVK